MKIDYKVFFLFLFLFGCHKKTQSPSEISLPELNLKLFVIQNGKKITFNEINKKETYTLDLSDEIVFAGLKISTINQNSKKSSDEINNPKKIFIPMETFTTCSMEGEKHTTEKQLTAYQTHFFLIDLLPEETLLNYKKEYQVSCSFLFIIRDKTKNEYFYNLPLLPILSVGKDISLKLVDNKSDAVPNRIVDADNMNQFDLILQKDRKAVKIKFLCEEIKESIVFDLNSEESIVSPFKFLQSLQKEQLPEGKKKCRILTYGKNHSANGITRVFQIDFDTLRKKEEMFSENLSAETTLKLFISHKGKKTALNEIIKNREFTLDLSDKVFFSLLDKSGNIKVESSEIFLNMQTSTNCLMDNKKYITEKKFSNLPAHFFPIDLLPEELFINYKKGNQISCSFTFHLKDKSESDSVHALPFLPVLLSEDDVIVKILNANNEEIGSQIIDANNMNHFNLTAQLNRGIIKIKFLCEGLMEEISFNLNGKESVFPPFKLLQSLPKEQLPKEKKKCRIVTYGDNHFVNGVTRAFQIDFETLTKDTPLWTPQSLQVEIDFVPDKEMSDYVWRKRKGKKKKNATHIISVFKIPGLFDQLPKNFSKEDYLSYKIIIDTECSSSLFSKESFRNEEGEFKGTYELPLSESFSVMSATPKEALQVYFPWNLTDLLTDIDPESLKHGKSSMLKPEKRNDIANYQTQVICSYHFQIKTKEEKLISIGWIKNKEIYWTPGSYGITFSNDRAKKGYPFLLEQIINNPSITADFLFLQNNPIPSKNFLPKNFALSDKMNFLCKGRQLHPAFYNPDFETIYEKDFFLDEIHFPNLPLAFFVNNRQFENYVKDNNFVKCRIILYREGVLQYFSQDIKFIYIGKPFLQKLNRLSTEDTLWDFDTLSRALFWM